MKIIEKIGALIGQRVYGGTGTPVGRMEAPDTEETAAAADENNGALRAYITLQVSPQASLAEIEEAFVRLQNTWRPDRYPNDRWRQESTQKLGQIREAYNRVLLARQEEAQDPVPEPPQTGRLNIPTPALPQETQQAAAAREDTEPPRRRFWPHVRRRWIVAMLLAVAAGCVLFLWPGMYHYDSLKVGNRVYPLRIHLLTARATYFDGNGWIAPPIDDRLSTRTPAGIPPVAVAVAPPLPAAAPSASGRAQPVPPPPRHTAPKLAEPPPVPATRPPPVARITPGKPTTPGGYSIQIRAFRDADEAKAFLQQLGAKRSGARIEKVSLEGSGTWYRILVQSFASRNEALKHLREERFFASYPGSFVQEAQRGR